MTSITRLACFLLALSTQGVSLRAQVSVQNGERLIPSDGSGGSGDIFNPPTGDNFGYSVAIAGSTAVVGAPYHHSLGVTQAGAAYVFQYNGQKWVAQSKLVASDAASLDLLGVACDISGDTIAVGATGGSFPGGSVYVFARQAGGMEQARLDGGVLFGASVAVDGDYLVVGAPAASTAGTAAVYQRQGQGWFRQALLEPASLSPSSRFGCSVSISDNCLAVGAQWDDARGPDSGSVYIFCRQDDSWILSAQLTASDAGAQEHFGAAVSIDGNVLCVGAPNDSETSSAGGAVYVFCRGPSGWSESQKLIASDISQGLRLGNSVSVCGDLMISGARRGHQAYVFRNAGIEWVESSRLLAFDDPLPEGDQFGLAVYVNGNHVLVGAPHDEPLGNDSGATYTYRINRRAGTAICFGIACPCGNTDASAGCSNSTGVGGALVGTGSRSVSCESSLEFTATQLPQPTSGLLYMGDTAIAAPLLDGVQCAGGTTYRLTGLMQTADGAGAIIFGPGVLGASGDLIDPGETWHFQAFYRDAVGSPCGAGANLTNAYSVTFLP